MHRTRLGSEVRRLRQQNGLRQRDLAATVHISPGFLSQLENDLVAPPSEPTITALAEALGADKDALLALAGRIPADVLALLKTDSHLWTVVRDTAHP